MSLRFIEWGCGSYGQGMIRQLYEKGAEIVGAIDRRPTRIGRDVGTVAGLAKQLDIPIHHPDDATRLLYETMPDVCIVCTRTPLGDVYDSIATIARAGVNCITLSEEAFFPWNTAPELASKLDDLAKEHDCTISASGMNDTLMTWCTMVLASSIHRIERLRVSIQYNIDLNTRLLTEHKAGLDKEEFEMTTNSQESLYSRTVAEWLCAVFAWKCKGIQQTYTPLYSTNNVYSKVLSADISSGKIIGLCDNVLLTTQEGIEIEYRCIGRVYTERDEDFLECHITGQPNLKITLQQPDYVEQTCASLINRIPQLIKMPSGYITTDKFPAPQYSHSL